MGLPGSIGQRWAIAKGHLRNWRQSGTVLIVHERALRPQSTSIAGWGWCHYMSPWPLSQFWKGTCVSAHEQSESPLKDEKPMKLYGASNKTQWKRKPLIHTSTKQKYKVRISFVIICRFRFKGYDFQNPNADKVKISKNHTLLPFFHVHVVWRRKHTPVEIITGRLTRNTAIQRTWCDI